MVVDDGNFYGTELWIPSTVFRITPLDAVTILHTFKSDYANNATGLIEGPDGNFYGTAARDGAKGFGCVYRITPSGSFTTLHSFSQALNPFIWYGDTL